MKKIALMLCVIAMIVFCSYIHFKPNVSAQAPNESETDLLQQKIDTFFDSLNEPSGSLRAYQEIFLGTQTPTVEIEKMAQQTDALTKAGRWKPEQIGTAKRVGNDLILMRYLYKSESHPVVWYFTFYRTQTASRYSDANVSGSSWNCIGIKFDTDLDSFFKESWSK